MDRRRLARLRKEYLFRQSRLAAHQEAAGKRDAVRRALADGSGARLSGVLKRGEAARIAGELHLDQPDAERAIAADIDDEYHNCARAEPRVLLTTSRDPSPRLQQFAKELRLLFPGAQRINRGGHVHAALADACRANGVTDLVIVHETRGTPDALIVSHFPFGPTVKFSLHNVVLRHDVAREDAGATVSEARPRLIMDGFTTRLGARVSAVLKHLFPTPREDSKRVMTFKNDGDFVSFRHHVFQKIGREVDIVEVGPRFELRPFEIRQGTIEAAADIEWVLRPYQRTARKRDML